VGDLRHRYKVGLPDWTCLCSRCGYRSTSVITAHTRSRAPRTARASGSDSDQPSQSPLPLSTPPHSIEPGERFVLHRRREAVRRVIIAASEEGMAITPGRASHSRPAALDSLEQERFLLGPRGVLCTLEPRRDGRQWPPLSVPWLTEVLPPDRLAGIALIWAVR
jgi:hypothetical protein